MNDKLDIFFSVVVPVYNKEPHIYRCISSVLKQSYLNFELIIVCEPSSDNSNAEVEKFVDERIRIIHRHNPGPGGYAARNFGIKHAQADWVVFLDADDEWFPDHLQKYSDLLRCCPEVVALSCGWSEVNLNNCKKINRYFHNNYKLGVHELGLDDFLRNCIERNQPIWTSVAALRKDCAENIFPQGYAKRGGDMYAWVKILTKGKMAWSPHIGATYYKDSVNMVTKTELGSLDLILKMVEELEESSSSDAQIALIKRFSNRRIWAVITSMRKKSQKISLIKSFYWRTDPSYCLLRTVLIFTPKFIPKICISFREKFFY